MACRSSAPRWGVIGWATGVLRLGEPSRYCTPGRSYGAHPGLGADGVVDVGPFLVGGVPEVGRRAPAREEQHGGGALALALDVDRAAAADVHQFGDRAVRRGRGGGRRAGVVLVAIGSVVVAVEAPSSEHAAAARASAALSATITDRPARRGRAVRCRTSTAVMLRPAR